MNQEYTIVAVHEQQRQITERCKMQHLKSLKDRACETQQEYINERNEIMR